MDIQKNPKIGINTQGISSPETLPEAKSYDGVRVIYEKRPDGTISVRTEDTRKKKPLQCHFDTVLSEFAQSTFPQFTEEYVPQSQRERFRTIKATAISFVKKYEETDGDGWYLWSETPGSGKTMLACIVASYITKMFNKSSQAIGVIDLLRRIRASYDDPDKSDLAVINPMKAVEVLVLDEVGAEKRSDFSEEVLYEIIDFRMNKHKTTLFTSNVSIADLPYHERLLSRIRRISVPIEMPGNDVRIDLAEQRDRELQTMLRQ